MAQTTTHASSGTLSFTDTQSVRGASASHTQSLSFSYAWANGIAANQCDRFYVSIGATLAASGTATFDLSGSLTDFTGATVSFVKLKEVIIQITSVVIGDILVIGAGSNPVPIFDAAANDSYSLGPGGLFYICEPSLAGICNVTNSTADILTLNNTGANTVTYNIAFAGTSA